MINIKSLFNGIDNDWIKVFTSDCLKKKLCLVIKNLEKEKRQITPCVQNIFNFARYTKYKQIKVVILGQDPYPAEGEANGLAFSCKKTQGSLRNIYKCLKTQGLVDKIPNNGDLTYWAQQGVLLLNTSLTTVVGVSNAHKHIWSDFINSLLEYMTHDNTCGQAPSLVFFLWGNASIEKQKYINEECYVMTWRHPSPIAQASAKPEEKFELCTHFNNANEFLESESLDPIDWNTVSSSIIYTDGACSGNGKGIIATAGYAVYFKSGPQKDLVVYGKISPTAVNGKIIYPSNQRAEGLAICIALETSKSIHNTIVTDSQFWIDMVEDYMPSWDRKGIDFDTKKNPDITKRLYSLINDNTSFIHIESHGKNKNANISHVKGNEIADKYAVKAKNLHDFEKRKDVLYN